MATLLCDIELEYHELSLGEFDKGLYSLARALAKRYCNYVQTDLLTTISTDPKKTMWYVHIKGEPSKCKASTNS